MAVCRSDKPRSQPRAGAKHKAPPRTGLTGINMCLGIPGQIVEVTDATNPLALVDGGGVR